ncbi:MAG: hypothetical protein ACOZEN_09005 [Thermodesulfobacteriota bacterium]
MTQPYLSAATPEEALTLLDLEHLKSAIDRVTVVDWQDPDARARFADELHRIATDIEELP